MRVATPADKALVEGIVNHPEVLPLVSCDGAAAFDAAPYLGDPNLTLIVEGGCFFCQWHGYGRVECHSAFLPTARGKNAVREGRRAIDYMFTRTNCFELVAKVAQNNAAADWYARAMGFRLRFERPHAWVKSGIFYPVRYYELDLDDWIMAGRFRAAAGDMAHDCYAGAAAEMIAHGQGEKARFFYDRWAQFAGRAPWRSIENRDNATEVSTCQ